MDSAESLATLAAVLAGFALSGLILVAASDRADSLDRGGLLGVWASLIPLVLVSLLYSELAGATDCREAVLSIASASLLFSMGGTLLLVSLNALLASAIGGEAARKFGAGLSWFVLVVVSLLVFTGTADLRTVTGDVSSWSTSVEGVVYAFALAAAIAASFVRSRRRGPTQIHFVRIYLLVAAALLANIFYVLAPASASWVPDALGWVRLVVTASFTFLVGLHIPAATRDVADAENPMD